jgi:hypothetical protein
MITDKGDLSRGMRGDRIDVATTIINQFGPTFPRMVGLKNVVAIEGGVQFGHAKGKQGINKVVVTLNAGDTYDLHFWRITAKTCKEITGVGDIYNDQLGDIFEDITGLYTHF